RLLGADAALRPAAGHRRSLAGGHADHAAGRVRPRHRAALRRALLPAAPLGPVHISVGQALERAPAYGKTYAARRFSSSPFLFFRLLGRRSASLSNSS